MIHLITNQAYLFLIFALDGAIIGLLFDFFRILRKSFKTKDFVTYIEDIIFWVLTGFLILYSIFIFNNGEIRFFMFLGVLLGIAIYMLMLSSYVIKINVYIISIIKKFVVATVGVISKPIIIIFKFIKKICIKPVVFLFINVKNITKNSGRLFSKTTKKLKTSLKNTKTSKNNVKKAGILK